MSVTSKSGAATRPAGKRLLLAFILLLQVVVGWGSATAAGLKQSLVDVGYYSTGLIAARGTIYANFATEAKNKYKLVTGLNVIRLPVPPGVTELSYSYQTSNASGTFKALYKKSADVFDKATDGTGLSSFSYGPNGFNGGVTIPSSEVNSSDGEVWIIASLRYVQATSVMNHSFRAGDRAYTAGAIEAWKQSIADGTAGQVDDGTVDDGTVDDGTVDDGTVDDGTVDDGTVDDQASSQQIEALQTSIDSLIEKVNAICGKTSGLDALCGDATQE